MRKKLLNIGLTLGIVLSLLALAAPASAVQATVSGPSEVQRPDPIAFTAAIEIRGTEDVTVDSFDLIVRSQRDDRTSVTLTFAPDGTVLSSTPARGVVGRGELRVNRLRNSLVVTPDENNPDPVPDDPDVGYGYGYGPDDRVFAFDVQLDSKAFKQGDYEIVVAVNTPDQRARYQSAPTDFSVVLPNRDAPGNDPPSANERRPSPPENRASAVDSALDPLLSSAPTRWVTAY